jgi:hypothetical protein
MIRSWRELVIENAVLRHPPSDLRRRGKRPELHLVDRLKLLIGARVAVVASRGDAVGRFEHADAPGLLIRLPFAIVGTAPVPCGTAQER